MNISNGIVWIVFDNHDKLVGCFTKEEFAKAACSGHTGWYYQGRINANIRMYRNDHLKMYKITL